MEILSDALQDYIHETKLHKDTNTVNWDDGNFILSTYDTAEGTIRLGVLNGKLLIHYVKINENLRKQGRFTKFIKHAMTLFDKVCVVGVGSPFVMITLNKLNYIDHGGDYIWSKHGICGCTKGKECTRTACSQS